jgi:hypothetical protein
MPESNNRDGRPSPDWPVCSYYGDGCVGIRIGTTAYCLAHLEYYPKNFKAFLTSLGPGASLDLRGTQLSSEMLDRLLNAFKTDEKQPPTIGDARFDRVQFSGSARFNGAQFSGRALFNEAQFSADARFTGAQFSGDARFDRAQFNGNAMFGAAQYIVVFKGNAVFADTQFTRDATFVRAVFDREAWFEGAQFGGDALFQGAQFAGRAGFSRAQFSENASFDAAQFNRDAEFNGAQFTATPSLGPLRANELVLNGASFASSVVVEVAAFGLSMIGTRFEQGAALWVRYAEVLLDEATFAKPTSLAFAETPFLPSPNPTDRQPVSEQPSPPQLRLASWLTLDEAPLAGRGLSPRPRLLSLRRTDATNLVLADLDLARCLFRGAHNLDKLRIEGPKHFATTPKRWRWTERRTLAEEHHWRHTRHPNQGWTPPSGQVLTGGGGWSMQPVLPTDPDHVAPLYRALRKAEEDAKYEPGAADFYYGEMEMRRHADDTPWVEKRLLWSYWLVAGYGLRGLRALLSLLAVVLCLAVLFQWIGFRGDPPSPWYWGSVLYAAKSTLSLPVQEQLSGWGEVLRILLRLTGPVLLGLALLSVRGRVKR